MSRQTQTASMTAKPAGGSAVVTVGVLALVLNLAVTALSVAGYRLFIPFNILGGFSFNLSALPLVTAIIVAFALWRYGPLSQGAAWVAGIFLFIVPVVVSFLMNYLTGVLLANLSNAAVTNSQNFYFILFLKSAASALSILVVAAIAVPSMRAWIAWVLLIVVWAGGDVLLFGLYRNAIITRDVYQWL